MCRDVGAADQGMAAPSSERPSGYKHATNIWVPFICFFRVVHRCVAANLEEAQEERESGGGEVTYLQVDVLHEVATLSRKCLACVSVFLCLSPSATSGRNSIFPSRVAAKLHTAVTRR